MCIVTNVINDYIFDPLILFQLMFSLQFRSASRMTPSVLVKPLKLYFIRSYVNNAAHNSFISSVCFHVLVLKNPVHNFRIYMVCGITNPVISKSYG